MAQPQTSIKTFLKTMLTKAIQLDRDELSREYVKIRKYAIPLKPRLTAN